jgi:integrase
LVHGNLRTLDEKTDLQRFYENISSVKQEALFLVFASSGLRRNENLRLTIGNVDFAQRMIIPEKNENQTKHSWVSFYNSEAEKALAEYLQTRKLRKSERLFSMSSRETRRLWRSAERKQV